MRALRQILVCGAAMTVGILAARLGTSTTEAASPSPPMFAAFGGAVLVGDGEVFVGEAHNQFRPGTVYVYRKSGSGMGEAATLNGPSAAVGDRFGTSLALDGSRLFVGAGPGTVHVFTKQGANWTLSSSIPLTCRARRDADSAARRAAARSRDRRDGDPIRQRDRRVW